MEEALSVEDIALGCGELSEASSAFITALEFRIQQAVIEFPVAKDAEPVMSVEEVRLLRPEVQIEADESAAIPSSIVESQRASDQRAPFAPPTKTSDAPKREPTKASEASKLLAALQPRQSAPILREEPLVPFSRRAPAAGPDTVLTHAPVSLETC
jgi:hypothetical protein